MNLEQQIADLNKKLLEQQDSYAMVRREILEKRRDMVNLRAELAPLMIAEHEAETNIRRTRTELKIAENEFWNQRNNR